MAALHNRRRSLESLVREITPCAFSLSCAASFQESSQLIGGRIIFEKPCVGPITYSTAGDAYGEWRAQEVTSDLG